MKRPMDPYDRFVFSAGIIPSTASVGAMLMTAYGMRQRLFPYSHSQILYLSCMIVTVFVCFCMIVATVYNYKHLLKEKKCEPHPKKQAFLLIWESVCCCVNIFLFIFSLI